MNAVVILNVHDEMQLISSKVKTILNHASLKTFSDQTNTLAHTHLWTHSFTTLYIHNPP